MSEKLCPHILLEGTRLTLKTEIAFALNEHPAVVGARRYRYHSPVVSAEWCAFTNTPWGRGLINFSPEEEPRAVETYRTWLRLFELLPYYSWIIDRFHLSTRMHQQLYVGRDFDADWIDEALARLNFRLVLCTRSADSFAAARAARLRVSGNPSQYDDLSRFVREQELLRELASGSRLPCLTLDVSDSDVSAATNRVAAWLVQTGGLTQPNGPR